MSRGLEEETEGTLEECVDEFDTFIEGLDRYASPVLADALRTHLAGLMRAMIDSRICTRTEARQFLVELEQEALGVD